MTFAGSPEEEGFDEFRMNLPVGIVVSKSSGMAYVADCGNNAVQEISSIGAFKTLSLNGLQAPVKCNLVLR
jgi:DNA-binding beta-propeller fold protein YncE